MEVKLMNEILNYIMVQLSDAHYKPMDAIEGAFDSDDIMYEDFGVISSGIADFFKIRVMKGDMLPKDVASVYKIFVTDRFTHIIDAIHNYITSNMESLNRAYFDGENTSDIATISEVMGVDSNMANILHNMKHIVNKCMMDIPVEMDGHMGEELLKYTSRDIPIDICDNISLFSTLVQDMYTDMKITTYISDMVTRKLLNKDNVAIII